MAKEKLRDKRRKFVKAYIKARKNSGNYAGLDKEFTTLETVLFVSQKTIQNDYYSE